MFCRGNLLRLPPEIKPKHMYILKHGIAATLSLPDTIEDRYYSILSSYDQRKYVRKEDDSSGPDLGDMLMGAAIGALAESVVDSITDSGSDLDSGPIDSGSDFDFGGGDGGGGGASGDW